MLIFIAVVAVFLVIGLLWVLSALDDQGMKDFDQ